MAEETAGAVEVDGAGKTKKKNKRMKYGFLIEFLIKVAAIVLASYAVLTYVAFPVRIKGNAMFPAAQDGDLGIFYKLDPYSIGDVVLYEDSEGNRRVGRIAASAGQEVDFPEGGGYLVNGYAPAEKVTYPTYADEGSDVKFPLKIGSGEYFLLNDFRTDSSDGRRFGAVPETSIKGKVIFILRRRDF